MIFRYLLIYRKLKKKKLIDQYKKLEKLNLKINQKNDSIENYEKENDKIIYQIYGLNQKEIEIIENSKNDRF